MNKLDEELYEGCCNCIYWQEDSEYPESFGRCTKYGDDTYAGDVCGNIEIREKNYPSSNYFSILD